MKGTINEKVVQTAHASISIRAPVKGTIFLLCSAFLLACYFNPRTREGCDLKRKLDVFAYIISIRAPVKGAIDQL